MSVKKSVMLHDDTLSVMKACAGNKTDRVIPWSNLVNRAIVVNDFLAREALPNLEPAEWQVILNTYAGTVSSIQHPPYRVASDMMDDMGLIDVEQHPQSELVKKVYNMTQCQQFAILSFVEKFWNNNWDDVEDFEEVIERIKNMA